MIQVTSPIRHWSVRFEEGFGIDYAASMEWHWASTEQSHVCQQLQIHGRLKMQMTSIGMRVALLNLRLFPPALALLI